jgi:hypothetical protein
MRRQSVSLLDRIARIWHKPIPKGKGAPEQTGPGTEGAIDHVSRPSRSFIFATSFVACWLIAIVFPIIDLFGALADTRTFSRDVYNLIMGTIPPQSPLFPKADPPPSQDPAKQVTVVLVDEATLDRFKLANERTWPASARFYNHALLSILRYKPRAVFVDMTFIDELPGSFAPFSDIANRYKTTGIPLLIVEPTYADGERPQQDFRVSGQTQVFEGLPKDAPASPVKPLTPKVAALVESGTIVPVSTLVKLDGGIVRSYQLFGRDAHDKPLKSASVGLYELASGQTLDLSGPPLEIFWDMRVPETNARWMDCVEQGWLDRKPFGRALQALLGPSRLKQTCGTVQTVPLAELFQPDIDSDAKNMIENNLVLFGSSIIGGDFHTVPVSDRLPGVYTHAMALENLLAFGGGYIRVNPRIGSHLLDDRHVAWLFEAPLIALVVSLFAAFRRDQEQGEEDSMWDKLLGALLNDAKLGLTTCAAGFALSMIMLPTLSLAPLNWLGMGAVAVLTNEIRSWTNIETRVFAVLRAPRGATASRSDHKGTIEGGMS